MTAELPGVCLLTGQTGAVNTGLLTGTDADGLSVHRIANGVGLGVLQSDQCHDQIPLCLRGQFLVGGHYVGDQFLIDLELVSALLEGDAEYLLVLQGIGHVVRVDLDDVVVAVPLLAQDCQRLIGVTGSDHAVGNLTLDDHSGGHVAHVRQSDPVAEGGHTVGAAGTCVGTSQRRRVQALDIVYEASLLQIVGQRKTQGGGGGANVLEGSGANHTGGFFQLAHQLPGVQCVQEIDVSRSAAQDGDGQFPTVIHIDAGRLLVGVATVLQLKFVHCYVSLQLIFTV